MGASKVTVRWIAMFEPAAAALGGCKERAPPVAKIVDAMAIDRDPRQLTDAIDHAEANQRRYADRPLRGMPWERTFYNCTQSSPLVPWSYSFMFSQITKLAARCMAGTSRHRRWTPDHLRSLKM